MKSVVRTDPPKLATEPFLSSLVRSSNDAIIGKTTEGVVVFWNEAAERLYGYDADEMIGREISILIPPDRPHELSSLLARARSGETVRNFRTERLRKDGTRLAVSITVAPVVDSIGTVLGMSTIAHDLTLFDQQITDLREAHRRADETLSTLETLHRSAPVGLGFVDRDFRVVHLNEVLAAVNGSTVEEQIGKTVEESVPDLWPQVEPVFRQVLKDGKAILNVEVSGEISSDPGHQRHWLSSYYPVYLDREIIGVGIVVVDVTERRQADDFRSIVMNNMAEGLLTVDARGRLTSMNAAATKMLGWTEKDLLGTEMRSLILPPGGGREEFEDGNKELLSVRLEGRHVRLEDHAYRCKNGSVLPVAISASPLVSGASVEGAVVVFRDITDEKSERLT